MRFIVLSFGIETKYLKICDFKLLEHAHLVLGFLFLFLFFLRKDGEKGFLGNT